MVGDAMETHPDRVGQITNDAGCIQRNSEREARAYVASVARTNAQIMKEVVVVVASVFIPNGAEVLLHYVVGYWLHPPCFTWQVRTTTPCPSMATGSSSKRTTKRT